MRLPPLIEPLAGGQKVDWNNMHAVGSDFPGGNWDYPEASYERRREIEQEHETCLRGFLWTMGSNPRVPEVIRKRTAANGLPKDEFADNGGWPWMIYICVACGTWFHPHGAGLHGLESERRHRRRAGHRQPDMRAGGAPYPALREKLEAAGQIVDVSQACDLKSKSTKRKSTP